MEVRGPAVCAVRERLSGDTEFDNKAEGLKGSEGRWRLIFGHVWF